MGRSPSVRVAALAGLGLALTGCLHGCGYACSLIGGSSEVVVALDPGARTGVSSLVLEVCQAEHCGDVAFSTTPPDPRYAYIQRGVTTNEPGAYVVALSALGKGWKPDEKARLVVRGVAATGTTVLRHTDTFRFTKDYPDGRRCDVTPYLSHTTRVGPTS